MFQKVVSKWVAPIVCLAVMAVNANAGSPTSLADDSDQYNAYVYSYVSMVYADGISNVIGDDSLEGEVAILISGFCSDGFFHCFDALVDDDDTLWQDAVDDLELARMWCDTLIVFVEDSQPASVSGQIETLMWYLDIAIANAKDCVPPTRLWRLPLQTSVKRW
ncbi:hypothetical protein [Rhodopirellula sallentina]|uniref:Secreted protein n=1 Tax=Rhodopirellula sallentina SM41 TaxID=1263870 RepID=M5U4V0_9BACT|nr:hypothetical protein [Rhodopirellula sallentina]EMI56284.1 secreted protein [Rhodopirellula sallentina SM41]